MTDAPFCHPKNQMIPSNSSFPHPQTTNNDGSILMGIHLSIYKFFSPFIRGCHETGVRFRDSVQVLFNRFHHHDYNTKIKNTVDQITSNRDAGEGHSTEKGSN